MSDGPSLLEKERDLVEEKLKALFQALELDVDLETEVEADTLYFNVTGADHNLFLHNRAEVIKQLSFLMQTYLDQSFPDAGIRLKMDAANHLRNKEREIQDMALNASEQLKAGGDEISLEPLNAYDRRLVHIALQENPKLQTESVGDGHLKRVVIRYVGD